MRRAATALRAPLRALARASRGHCDSTPAPGARAVAVTFVASKTGAETKAEGFEGESLVALAHRSGVDLEGACACSLACSTCHVILQPEAYNALEPAGEDEEDLLDLAFGLTPTCVAPGCPSSAPLPFSRRATAPSRPLPQNPRSSRLGCQVKLSLELEGARVRLPSATRNMYVDGFVPKPH